MEYNEEQIICNIQKVKLLEFAPLFISLSHHFYNGIAGHAYSLGDGLRKLINQDLGANSGITELGMHVLDHLLNPVYGKRIFPDIKHMSRKSRRQYYAYLKQLESKGQNIPIIVSHGAVNGRPSVYAKDEDAADNGLFYGGDINFYDDEIVLIAKSKGFSDYNSMSEERLVRVN